MFSIGEFARLGGVSIRTLRHYDEIDLLRPATVDLDTGYRGYSAAQLGQINRIMALKELGLSLAQIRGLLGGIMLDELRGMLLLRRARLEQELDQHKNQLLGIEARLRAIAREDAMTADDIVAKTIPATGVVVIAGQAPGFGAANIVPVVNRLVAQFDQLGIPDRVKEAGPRVIFYECEQDQSVAVVLALPVSEPCAAARPRPSFRWSTRIWSGGSRNGATTPSPAQAVKCGYTIKTTSPTPARKFSRSSCPSPARPTPMRGDR